MVEMRGLSTLSEVLPLLAVVFILSSALLFGPLSPLSNQDSDSASEGIASGTANVTISTPPPTSLNLVEGRFDSGQYVLHIPATVVHIHSVEGRPLLTYKVELTKLGHSQSTIAELQNGSEGSLRISPEPISISAERVQNDTYTAELSIVLRASGKQTLYRENVTVNVER